MLETKLRASKMKLLMLEMKLHPYGAMEVQALEWGWKVCKMGLKKKGDDSFKNPPQMKLLQVVGLGGRIALHPKRTGAGMGPGRLLHWEEPIIMSRN